MGDADRGGELSRIALIVQARMGSSRLPGKSLRPFGSSTLVQHVVRRLTRMRPPVDLWVATTTNSEDDALAEACEGDGVPVFRGSADDVLGRFAACVEAMPERPDAVVRMCADRPFACPRLVDELLGLYGVLGAPDYLANNLPMSFPDGFDVEVVRTDCLLAAVNESEDAYEREHVTPFVYRRPERFTVLNRSCPYGNFAGVRATLDTEHDYERLRDVHERLAAVDNQYEWRDVLNLATLAPELFP